MIQQKDHRLMRPKRKLLYVGLGIAVILGTVAIITNSKPKTITADSKLSAIYAIPELKPLKNYLIYMGGDSQLGLASHFVQVDSLDPNGNLLYGLERLRTVMQEGSAPICVYDEAACAEDPEKAHSNILFFPSLVRDSDKPFIIVIAGGGYSAVCSLLEGYPVARRFNELGYPVFVLNYRLNKENGIFPRPLEDIAQSLHYIYEHHNDFGLNENHKYIVGGFSAGGHISAEWGTDNEGYLKYDLPAPSAIFLGYAAISSRFFISDDTEAMTTFREGIVGKNYTDEMEARFSADLHVHAAYPPTYIVYCADDDMVDPAHSRAMEAALNEYGVKNVVEEGEHGGHGFAAGFQTSVEGWIDRTDQFFEDVLSGTN